MNDQGVAVDLLCSVEKVGVSPSLILVEDLDLSREVSVLEAEEEPFFEVFLVFDPRGLRVGPFVEFTASGVPLEESLVTFSLGQLEIGLEELDAGWVKVDLLNSREGLCQVGKRFKVQVVD